MRLLSFSLYGADPLYCRGAIRNAELAPRFYPGWTVRFAVDRRVPADVLDGLRARGCEVVRMERSLGPEYGKFWRFLVAADPAIERFACRDADSRLNAREQAAVAAWLESGKPFHVMRDSAHHVRRIMGGMWGGVGGGIPDIAARIDAWGRYARWGDSDLFLSEVVWPLIAGRVLCHDSTDHFGDAEPFPPHAPLAGTCYVGEIVPVDRPPLDVWHEVGVLRDQIVRLHGEIARREDEMLAAQAELARQATALANLQAELARRTPSAAATPAHDPGVPSLARLRRWLARLERRRNLG